MLLEVLLSARHVYEGVRKNARQEGVVLFDQTAESSRRARPGGARTGESGHCG